MGRVSRRLLCALGIGVVASSFNPVLAATRHEHGTSRALGRYDGAWMVSSEGSCAGLGSGQVTIVNGRVIAPGGAGRVSPGGAVHTISNVNGTTVVGDGQINGSTAAGSFRQSDGCTGTWTAVKM